jgi:hypothetical protein
MNFVLGPISMNVVFRVGLEATALQCAYFDTELRIPVEWSCTIGLQQNYSSRDSIPLKASNVAADLRVKKYCFSGRFSAVLGRKRFA